MRSISKVAINSRTKPWEKTILGQPYSKANSRQIINVNGRTRVVKSRQALKYSADFAVQCPVIDPLFEGPVHVEIDIYYASKRPDLDESIILDALQGRVYRNDRQVRSKKVVGWIDADNPRAVIRVEALAISPWTSNPGFD